MKSGAVVAILMAIFFCSQGALAAQTSFEVGDSVLLKCCYQCDFKVAHLIEERDERFRVSGCGAEWYHPFKLMKYTPVAEYSWYGLSFSKKTLRIGDRVRISCLSFAEDAVVTALADQGYAQVRYGHESSNAKCGERFHSVGHLRR